MDLGLPSWLHAYLLVKLQLYVLWWWHRLPLLSRLHVLLGRRPSASCAAAWLYEGLLPRMHSCI
jgi:hypothetical protein